MNTIDRIRNEYGVNETNELVDPTAYYQKRSENGVKYLSLKQFADAGGIVTRVRILSERIAPGTRIYDISYIHGVLPDGTDAAITDVPTGIVGNKFSVTKEFIEWAKSVHVFAKPTGLLDKSRWSTMS